ncbi:ELWxxDGT repeat protein [Rubrivirga marina]|uniref:Secretion system C-terminal sorting domain-containing protein n=1 Tax=Rubrivirga marina TaxID=1196024 RepID=A0A271IZ38_9BACT|nr:ELWxxDGT repeat protein [Rubrivirga marina]PAP76337.1 hypothetical protein BSZ37_07710 [Rubrivirga marina]
MHRPSTPHPVRPRTGRGLVLLAIAAALAGAPLAQPLSFVDLRPGVVGGAPTEFVVFDGALYFTADDSPHGRELWRTDGTVSGTTLVKDINSGGDDSRPSEFFAFDGALYFSADDGATGRELWRTDGTAAGTTLVKDINPGPEGSLATRRITEFVVDRFAALGGALYFAADDGAHGIELWRTDGTETGTVLVKDIRPGPDGSVDPPNRTDFDLTPFKGALYFQASNGTDGYELWRTDGTAAGTALVKDIQPGAESGFPQSFVGFDGALYFAANDGTAGIELWRTDGTAAGTVLVKDILPGPGDGFGFDSLMEMAEFDGALYFWAEDSLDDIELWKSDGTPSGTARVRDIKPGPGASYPTHFHVFDGALYFRATDGTHGFEPWRTDGTEAGTVLVKDVDPGPDNGFVARQGDPGFVDVDGALYFVADDGVTGRELWSTDGTEAGTALVGDVNPGAGDGQVSTSGIELAEFDGALYFNATDGAAGVELWKLGAPPFMGGVAAEGGPDPEPLAVLAWPNPAADRLRVAVVGAGGGPVQVEVVDVLGRRVAAAVGTWAEVDVSGRAPGPYVVRARAGARTATRVVTVGE